MLQHSNGVKTSDNAIILFAVKSLRFRCVLRTMTAQNLRCVRSRQKRTKQTATVRSSQTPLLNSTVKHHRALALIHHNAKDAPAVATSLRIKAMYVQVKRMLTIKQICIQRVLLRLSIAAVHRICLRVTIKCSAIGFMDLMMAVTTSLYSVTW